MHACTALKAVVKVFSYRFITTKSGRD